ncbi:MAG: terpene cyclase/mutase family protein [Acidimicrobiales bacterium]|nr:terpene cyclase/mutase family protein [Acidimicrobiales bacterium]
MHTKTSLRRLAAYGAGIALIGSGIALAAPSQAAVAPSANLADSARIGVNWLLGELGANEDRFQQSFDGQKFDDIGLTIDALLAVASAGGNNDAQATESANYVVSKAASYVSFDSDRYAGPLGKLMVFAQARGISTTNLGGFNLENEIRDRLQPSGRFSDKSEFGDFSNGVGQAFDMMALAKTTAKVPANAVTWLLAQQCPDGGFRTDYSEGVACTSNDDSDLDGTSFALLALSVSTLSEAQEAKVDDAIDYLFDNQESNGLIGNANSSGLAASALRTYGLIPDANDIAAAVEDLQLTSGQVGAIALTPADATDKKANGIDDNELPVYWRSTAQAALALGLPSYVDRGVVAPVKPEPHIESSTATAKQGDPVTVTGGGFEAGETVSITILSDPVDVGSVPASAAGEVNSSFTVPASVPAGSHTIRLAGASSGVVVTAPLTVTAAQVASTTTSTTAVRATIVRTGSTTDAEALAGGALVIAGAALVLATRRRKIIYPFQR